MAFGDLAKTLKKIENKESESDYSVYYVQVDKQGNYFNPKQLVHNISKEDYKDWLAIHDAGVNGKFVLIPNTIIED